MKVLVLDDDHSRLAAFRRKFIGHDVTCVETASGAIESLFTNRFDAVFLDHDLGGEIMVDSKEGTGYEVALWLQANPDYAPEQIFIHSFNPVGAANMGAILPQAVLCPGFWSYK